MTEGCWAAAAPSVFATKAAKALLLTVAHHAGTKLAPRGTRLAHISTPARAASALKTFADVILDAQLVKATELRLAGNAAVRAGDLHKAIALYSEVRWGMAVWFKAPRSAVYIVVNSVCSSRVWQFGDQVVHSRC